MKAVRAGSGLVELRACRRLFKLAQQVRAGRAIVELGSHRGRSTGWLAAGARPGVHVHAVDPWSDLPDDAVSDEYAAIEPAYRNGRYVSGRAEFDEHLARCGVADHVTAHQSTGSQVASEWDDLPVGLLFHDATHSYEAVRDDLLAWLPHLDDVCAVACHDLGNPGFGVEAAAHDVLRHNGFEWRRRELMLWRKDPTRRGLLVVHRG